MRKMLAVLAAVLAIPAAAHASQSMGSPQTLEATRSPWYVTTKLGVYMPQSDDLEGMNNGLSTEIQLGRRFNANFERHVSAPRGSATVTWTPGAL